MKFKFNLDKVLRHRKILEDLAQKDFQEAMSQYNAKLAEIEQMEEAKKSARETSFTLTRQTGGQVAESLKQIQEFLILQDIRIARERQKLAEIEKLVEAKREVLRQKAMDKKILERLETKKREEFQAERMRREQKEIDDNSSMRFETNKKIRGI